VTGGDEAGPGHGQARPRTYTGWQPERSGFVGRLSGVGFCAAAAALIVGMLPVYTADMALAALAWPIAALLAALALVPVAGMPADEWVVLFCRYRVVRMRRAHLFASGVFAPRHVSGAQPLDLPGVLASTRLLQAPTGTGGSFAVVNDRAENAYTAVLRISYPGLALSDVEAQDRRVAAWGSFLASLCVQRGVISRVAVVERAQPDDGTALVEWTRRHLDPAAPRAAVDTLDELLAVAGPVGVHRDTFLSVTVSATRARAMVRAAGGGDVGACAVLARELGALQPAIWAADLRVTSWLTVRELAEAVRVGFDPDSVAPLAGRLARQRSGPAGAAREGLAPGVDPSLAGPAAAEAGWSLYRHDGAWSVTYQVRAWPRSPVYASVLQPLLRPVAGARRCLAMVCEPLGPRRAERELARARTRRHALISMRRGAGRLDSPDEVADLARAEAQDVARAGGHGVLRYTALLTVTVTEPGLLEAACVELQADAASAGLELRRLYGAQDSGFAAGVLPLGMGLPVRRLDL
jgi:hypothetical protein